MMYEIRNYHLKPEVFETYKHWAKTHAIPELSKTLDLVGFWVNTDEPSQVTKEPMDALGSANVTWILRWRDMAHRDEGLAKAISGPSWEAVFAKLPGGLDNYLRMESKFTEALV